MTDYEFGQAVMKAAGMTARKRVCMCDGQECRSGCDSGTEYYPDPLKPEGFCELWDALERKSWRIHLDSGGAGQWIVCAIHVLTSKPVERFYSPWVPTRYEALLQTAAQALGVTR